MTAVKEQSFVCSQRPHDIFMDYSIETQHTKFEILPVYLFIFSMKKTLK